MSNLDFSIGARRDDFDPYANPIRFEVNGHVFEAIRRSPGGIVYDMLVPAASNDGLGAARSTKAMLEFLEIVLLPESFAQFTALMHSLDDPIEQPDVQQVIAKLCEVYSDRPTGPRGRSQLSSRTTATSSTAVSPSRDSTGDASASTGS
jgi:hypothetical protein